MGNFSKKILEGSYRLPFRVSECLMPLSSIINKKFGMRDGYQVNIISPYKGAPPGSRPILIYASNTEVAASKICEIYNAFRKPLKLDKHKACIFEWDPELAFTLNQLQIPTETTIILRTKGLEKDCVIWSTRTKVDTKGEYEEFVYTILTRTVCLLIIVVFPELPLPYHDIITKLVPERLMRWDEETEHKYQELLKINAPVTAEDDEDNSEDMDNFEDDALDGLIA